MPEDKPVRTGCGLGVGIVLGAIAAVLLILFLFCGGLGFFMNAGRMANQTFGTASTAGTRPGPKADVPDWNRPAGTARQAPAGQPGPAPK